MKRRESAPDAAEAQAPVSARRAWAPVVYRAISTAALVAVVVSAALNWLWLTRYSPVRGLRGTAGFATRYEPATNYLPDGAKPALEMLPPAILQFETTARHYVPNKGRTVAEAMYATLNMNIEAQVSTVVYARVEVLPSSEAARQRVRALVDEYNVSQRQLLLGGATQAYSGYAPDEGAYAVLWQRDTSVTLVKTQFRDKIPVTRGAILIEQGNPVAGATDAYQRTGKAGAELGTIPTATVIGGGQ